MVFKSYFCFCCCTITSSFRSNAQRLALSLSPQQQQQNFSYLPSFPCKLVLTHSGKKLCGLQPYYRHLSIPWNLQILLFSNTITNHLSFVLYACIWLLFWCILPYLHLLDSPPPNLKSFQIYSDLKCLCSSIHLKFCLL